LCSETHGGKSFSERREGAREEGTQGDVPVEIGGHADNVEYDAPPDGHDGLATPEPKHDELVQNVRNGTLPLVAFLAGEDEDVGLDAVGIKIFLNVVQVEGSHAGVQHEETTG